MPLCGPHSPMLVVRVLCGSDSVCYSDSIRTGHAGDAGVAEICSNFTIVRK